MATLTVKNIGPIREAELEVKKHTIFIGPQGSGKSTLAKLIAIGADEEIVYGADINQEILAKYSISNYTGEGSYFSFEGKNYGIIYDSRIINIHYSEDVNSPIFDKDIFESFIKDPDIKSNMINISQDRDFFERLLSNFALKRKILLMVSSYVPAERTLLSILNNSIWNLIHSNVEFPKSITSFARLYAQNRLKSSGMRIPFLMIDYQSRNDVDYISTKNGKELELSQSASGYQSLIPIFVVVEQQKQQSSHRFIIEEPELNLYPTAQKDLIYALIGGLQPDIKYHDAEWVITTHSPYVLSAYNTLILAYKVASKSEELRAEVAKIIPSRCWINPDDFAAYYVDEGTTRSIINPKTGLIMDNELDDVSEQLAAEQDQLLELNRSVPRD